MPPALFFLMVALASQGLLWLHMNLRIVHCVSMENSTGILIGTALNLQVAVGCMDILTLSFCLFVLSPISYINVVVFSVRFFTALVELSLTYSIFPTFVSLLTVRQTTGCGCQR